jgi:hypothetical protein
VLQHPSTARAQLAIDLFPVIKAEAFGGVGRRLSGALDSLSAGLSSGRSLRGAPKGAAAPLAASKVEDIARAVMGAYQSGTVNGPKCADGCAAPPEPVSGAARPSARVTASEVGPIVTNPDGTKSITVLCKPAIPTDTTTYMTCYVELPSDM